MKRRILLLFALALVGAPSAAAVGFAAGDSEILRGAIAYAGGGLQVATFLAWVWMGRSKGD